MRRGLRELPQAPQPPGLFRAHSQHQRRGAVADAHAVDAHVNQLEEVPLVADAAGALNLTAPARRLHHQRDHLTGRSIAFPAGEKSSRGLQEVRASGDARLASLPDLVQRQRVGLKDDLHRGAAAVTGVHHRADIGFHLGEQPAADPAVVRDNVQLGHIPSAAVLLSLHHFRAGGGEPERKVAHHADLRVRAAGQFGGNVQRRGVDAHSRAAKVNAFLDVPVDFGLGEFRFQHGLVDIGRQLPDGHFACLFGGVHGVLLLFIRLYSLLPLLNQRHNQQRGHANQLHEDQRGRAGHILERIPDGIANHRGNVLRRPARVLQVLNHLLGVVKCGAGVIEKRPQQRRARHRTNQNRPERVHSKREPNPNRHQDADSAGQNHLVQRVAGGNIDALGVIRLRQPLQNVRVLLELIAHRVHHGFRGFGSGTNDQRGNQEGQAYPDEKETQVEGRGHVNRVDARQFVKGQENDKRGDCAGDHRVGFGDGFHRVSDRVEMGKFVDDMLRST